MSVFISNMVDVWNNGATTFTAIKMNVTDTASDAASLLMNLQVGGIDRFKLRKDGLAFFTNDIYLQNATATQNYFIVNTNGLLQLISGGAVQFSSSATNAGASGDVIICRDAANVLALRNGVNAQVFRVYNTWTDNSNFEKFEIQWASNAVYLYTGQAGTGSIRTLNFGVGNQAIWQINPSGHWLAITDNTYDIGASGANRPRDLFLGRNFSMNTAALLSIKSGANQRAGNATLVGGTVTVSNTTITANTIVIITRKTSGGTIGTAITYTLSAGTSFTITSDNVLDTSTLSYFLIEVP